MAVTINSNGTITGIAAGGLPDGVVDTDTLAADAVTAAKVADNAVTTAKINADAVTAAKVADDVINSEHLVDGGVDNAHLATGIASSKLSGALPAISGAALTGISGGKVLQHITERRGMYNQNTTSTTEQNVEYSSGNVWELAITPASTSNYLFITGVYGIAFSASNTQNRYNLKPYIKIGSGSYAQMLGNYTTGYYHTQSSQYGVQTAGLYPFHIKFSPNTTSECKIKLTYKVQHSGYGASITVNPHTGGETWLTVQEISG